MVPEQDLAVIGPPPEKDKEMTSVQVQLPLAPNDSRQPIVPASHVHLADRQIDPHARWKRQHARVSASAAASCATYPGSAPTGTRSRRPATRSSSRTRAVGRPLTVTGTRRTSVTRAFRTAIACCSRRSLYSQYWKIARPTPASAANSLRDLPLPSKRAINADQNRRLSSRCLMRARLHHLDGPRKTPAVGRLRRKLKLEIV